MTRSLPVTAIGCRVKSGWATTVLLAGPPSAPRVLDRRRIALSDPSVPESTQPYHAGFGTAQTDTAAVKRLTRVVTRCASRSMAALVRAYRALGASPPRIGIVVGSTLDPASIANQHIRAHAHEGRLFRIVVEAAVRRHGIRPVVLLERDLYTDAARALGGSPLEIRHQAAELGRPLGRPWRAEEKAAAVAAWLVLASRRVPAKREGPRRGTHAGS